MPSIPSEILQNARRLRTTLTDAEQLLWHLMRDRRFCGCKFRRQHRIRRFVVDFYCHERRLAIELDGGGHSSTRQALYDAERTKELQRIGVTVLRSWNDDVLVRTEDVLSAIFAALFPHPALRATLSQGERE